MLNYLFCYQTLLDLQFLEIKEMRSSIASAKVKNSHELKDRLAKEEGC